MASTLRLFAFHVSMTLVLLLLLVTPGLAQFASGIEGTILDQSGAEVAGAQCTVINQDTQVQQSAVSDVRGFVRILHLSPGKYRVEVEVPGFEKWVQPRAFLHLV